MLKLLPKLLLLVELNGLVLGITPNGAKKFTCEFCCSKFGALNAGASDPILNKIKD